MFTLLTGTLGKYLLTKPNNLQSRHRGYITLNLNSFSSKLFGDILHSFYF